MKKTRLNSPQKALATLAMAALFTGCTMGGDTNPTEEGDAYPYPFESAIIQYELKGNVEGTITVTFDGDRSSHETNVTTVDGQIINNTLLDIGDTLYQFDHETNLGHKAPNPIYTQIKAIDPAERKAFMTKLAVGAAETGEAPEPKGQKEIAGQTCELYDLKGIGEICMWDGVPLYSSVIIPEQGINNTNTAVSIQLNPEIPEDTFEIPSDIEITEV